MAMETRGFGGGPRSYLNNPALTVTDFVLLLLFAIMLVVAVIARVSGYENMFYLVNHRLTLINKHGGAGFYEKTIDG